MPYLFQFTKMAALATVIALTAARWLDPLNTALAGVLAFYLLLVRAS